MFMYSVAWNLNRTTVRATITSIPSTPTNVPSDAIPFIYTHFKYSANIHWPVVSITESRIQFDWIYTTTRTEENPETQPRVVDQVKRCAFPLL